MKSAFNYIKSRRPGWWITNILLILVIVLLIFPSIRQDLIVWMARQGLDDPKIEKREQYPLISSEDYKFMYTDMEGAVHSLSEHRNRVVFINFWATWCTHCLAEMPGLEELYKDFNDDVEFLFISYEDMKTLRAFDSKKKYKVPFYGAVNRLKSVEVTAWPTTVIISKKGELVLYDRGAKDWNTKAVRNLLSDLSKE